MTRIRKIQSLGPQFLPLSIVRALWRRKWLIAGLAMLGTAASVVIVSRMEALYAADAVILVESQKIPENFVAATVQTALEARLDMLKQQVLSRDRLWGLIESLRLYPKQRARLTKDEVLELMRKDLRIELLRGWSTRGPGAFRVQYLAPDPEIAVEVANRIGMFFITENLNQRTAEAAGTSEFLDRQLEEAQRRLREQEARLRDFKSQFNGELPQQEAALLAFLSQSRTELLSIQESMGRAQQNKLILENSLAYAESNLREREEAIRRERARRGAVLAESSVATAAPAPTELERAREQLRLLRARYMDSHPEVQRLVAEVRRLEREEAERLQAATPPAPAAASAPSAEPVPAPTTELLRLERDRIQELRAQIALIKSEMQSLENRRQRILAEMSDAQQRLSNIPAREQQLASITRDYETTRGNYQSLLNKKLAADVAADMERWQKSQRFVMLDPARLPQKPARPRRALWIGAGTVLSWLSAALLGFLLELKKNAVLGEWELPEDVEVLARVPEMKLART